jgi:hypothetical protein
VLEAELYTAELLGEAKPPETLRGLLKVACVYVFAYDTLCTQARRVLAMDFGRINVTFAPLLSVAEYQRRFGACVMWFVV